MQVGLHLKNLFVLIYPKSRSRSCDYLCKLFKEREWGGGEGENHSLTEFIMMNDSSDKCRKFFPLIHEYFGDVRLF